MKQKRAGNLATRKRERYKKTTTRIQKVKLCYVSIYGHRFITTRHSCSSESRLKVTLKKSSSYDCTGLRKARQCITHFEITKTWLKL